MIIPVKCFTCGKVIANKWQAYVREVEKQEREANKKNKSGEVNEDEYANNFDRNFKGKILDDLGLDRICCRRHMLAHVELIDTI